MPFEFRRDRLEQIAKPNRRRDDAPVSRLHASRQYLTIVKRAGGDRG
jgi:hypothetical protein